MTSFRFILVAAAVLLLPAEASAHTPAPAALTLSSAGRRALEKDGIALSSVAPATRRSRTIQLPISKAAIASGATVELAGTLRVKAAKRKLDLKRLSVVAGASAITVKAASLKLFKVTPTRPATIDRGAGSISLTGARIAFTKDAASRLKKALKLKRAPSTKALGTLTFAWVPHDDMPQAAAPQPQPVVTTPAATPSPTPAPTPASACPSFDATPAGSVDWFACDLPGANDLHSWTDYVQRQLPGPCPWQQGTVTASGGAARIDPASAYDHRLPVASVTEAGGKTIVQLTGAIEYTMPVHGIDERIANLRIELEGDRGAVYADGHSKTFDMSPTACTKAPDDYAGVHLLDLDLSSVAPVTAGGVKRWVHVPATVVPGTGVIGGGQYDGRPWGAFTIAVPAS